jgi:hypothetical protein
MAEWKQSSRLAMATADHFTAVTTLVPPLLNVVDAFHRVLGPWPLKSISGARPRAAACAIALGSLVLRRTAMPMGAFRHSGRRRAAAHAAVCTMPNAPRFVTSGLPRAGILNKASFHYIPDWNPYFPRGAAKLGVPKSPAAAAPSDARRIPRQVRSTHACQRAASSSYSFTVTRSAVRCMPQ